MRIMLIGLKKMIILKMVLFVRVVGRKIKTQ